MWDGLRVELRPPAPPPATTQRIRDSLVVVESRAYHPICQGAPAVRIDPGQLPKIRRQWHDRLDVEQFSIPFVLPGATLLFSVLPTMSLWRWGRSIWRVRRGLCGACGYDLRESAGVCPECGARGRSATWKPSSGQTRMSAPP